MPSPVAAGAVPGEYRKPPYLPTDKKMNSRILQQAIKLTKTRHMHNLIVGREKIEVASTEIGNQRSKTNALN